MRNLEILFQIIPEYHLFKLNQKKTHKKAFSLFLFVLSSIIFLVTVVSYLTKP